MAYVLLDEANGDNVDTEFLRTVGAQTQRLGYRIYNRGAFVIGVLWSEPFAWPDETTTKAMMDKMARETLANARN